MLYLPAASKTTLPLGQEASAAFNCASVALAPADVAAAQAVVTQIVVRFGTPPGTPAVVQSIARDGAKIPDHACCAWAAAGITSSNTSKIEEEENHCLRFIIFFAVTDDPRHRFL